MATLRTMNRRRRMRTNEGIVVGVYSTDAAGKMIFRYEKAVAGRWQRYTPRGKAGALAEYSASLGEVVISDAELAEWMAQFEDEGEPTTEQINEYVDQRAVETIIEAAEKSGVSPEPLWDVLEKDGAR